MADTGHNDADQVHRFWFDTLSPKQWFKADTALDRHIAARFGALILAARSDWLADWRDTPRGRLAEILLLDQFPRNVYRGQGEAFAGDALARRLANDAITAKADATLSPDERIFVYMPFMHSEDLADHDRASRLFDALGRPDQQRAEARHRKILERFGRYPQRNAALARQSTPEERRFLKQPGAGF